MASYIWELPFGRGRRFGNDWNRAMDLLLGGWQLSGIHVLQSGLALTATLGGSTVLNIGGERRARPNLVGDPELPDIAAHDRRAGSTPTRSRRSSVRRRRSATPASGSCAVRATRTSTSHWPRTSRRRATGSVQFRAEVFNAFNRANFGPPNIARDSSGFGQILSAGNARIMQFGLKFYF